MTMSLDERTQPLDSIVPEYESRNAVVRWLFTKRLDWARAKLLELVPGGDVLDAGCGDGRLVRMLAGDGFGSVAGVDFNENILKLTIPGAELYCGDLKTIQFSRSAFDAISILDVLEHIKVVTPIIERLFTLVNPGGYLLASLPTENAIYKLGRFVLKGTFSSEEGPATGVHYHDAAQLHTLICRSFTPVSCRYLPFYPPFDLFNLRVYQRLER